MHFILAIVLWFTAAQVHAQDIDSESLGELKVSDFLLAPRFSYSEPDRGHFQPGDSYIAVRWRRDEVLGAQITLGTQSLINIPNRYTQVNNDAIGVVEAFGEGDSSFGRFRFGLVPIPFGVEGGIAEGRLRFVRSQIFEKGIVGLRDYGASYSIQHDRFFSDWVVHNGEGGRDLDNQMWFTARWGYLIPGLMRMGFSGQTGRTNRLSTDPTGTYAAGASQGSYKIMNLAEDAKFRIGNAFINYDSKKFAATLEATTGDVIQTVRRKFLAAHLDLYMPLSAKFAGLARYDSFDSDQPSDKDDEATLGVSYRTSHGTSEIYLFGTQEFKPGSTPDVHRFLIMWRLTPQIFDRR